jgi:hypothetical protein
MSGVAAAYGSFVSRIHFVFSMPQRFKLVIVVICVWLNFFLRFLWVQNLYSDIKGGTGSEGLCD